MATELEDRDGRADPIENQIEAALHASDDDAARYHLREALQLRIAEKNDDVTQT